MTICGDCGIEHLPRPGLNCRRCGRWVAGFARHAAQRWCAKCELSCETLTAIVGVVKHKQPAAKRTRSQIKDYEPS